MSTTLLLFQRFRIRVLRTDCFRDESFVRKIRNVVTNLNVEKRNNSFYIVVASQLAKLIPKFMLNGGLVVTGVCSILFG
jgi:hypothetical protein